MKLHACWPLHKERLESGVFFTHWPDLAAFEARGQSGPLAPHPNTDTPSLPGSEYDDKLVYHGSRGEGHHRVEPD